MSHVLGATPSPLWFATRGLGTATLLLLTVSVALGVATVTRWSDPLWPRFAIAEVHRNLSLMVLLLLGLHVATAVLDPFARLGIRDAVVPYGASYRPVWLGLGAVALEILLAVALTSVLRTRLGHRPWRLVHWLAYAAWPLAVLHGLGSGSDTRTAWSVGITAACVASVLLVAVWRLGSGWPSRRGRRLAAAAFVVSGTAALASWAAGGPLRADWPSRVTPAVARAPAAAAVAVPSGGVDDALAGRVVAEPGGGRRLVLVDLRDRTLTLVLGPGARLAVFHGARQLCDAAATGADNVTAACAGTVLSISVAAAGGLVDPGATISGRLLSSTPIP